MIGFHLLTTACPSAPEKFSLSTAAKIRAVIA